VVEKEGSVPEEKKAKWRNSVLVRRGLTKEHSNEKSIDSHNNKLLRKREISGGKRAGNINTLGDRQVEEKKEKKNPFSERKETLTPK